MIRANRQLRIAVVSDVVYPYHRGGKEMRIHYLTHNLAAMGHEVHVYTMKWWEGENNRIEDGIHLHAISPLYPLYAGERRSIKQGLMFGLATLKMLRYEFDILEVDHMPYFPLFAAKIVSVLKRRTLYATWHEVVGPKLWRDYLGRLGFIANAIEWLSVRLPDRIIAVSPYTAERLVSVLHTKTPISTIDNGIQLSVINDAPVAAETSDLIFVGRLLSHKNAAMLVRAIAKLAPSRPGIRCLIVGEGPETGHVRQLIAELDLSQNVIMKGSIEPHSAVFSLMKASRLFVLPSIQEGFGIVALEAMACGLRVVTTDHANNAARLLINDTTGSVCAPSVDALANAIDLELSRTDSSDTTRYAASYDWQERAAALQEVYAQ